VHTFLRESEFLGPMRHDVTYSKSFLTTTPIYGIIKCSPDAQE
jgi:hypothetical protein